MSGLGKTLIFLGMIVTAIGLIITFSGKISWIGKLPGDIYVKRQNITFYFPLATCILLSAILTFFLWLFRK